MFSVCGINFQSGAYYNGKMNGAQAMIMQSQEYTDKLIEQFGVAIAAGYNPNDVIDDVFNKVGCSDSDLTNSDKQRLMRTVEKMYQTNRY